MKYQVFQTPCAGRFVWVVLLLRKIIVLFGLISRLVVGIDVTCVVLRELLLHGEINPLN